MHETDLFSHPASAADSLWAWGFWGLQVWSSRLLPSMDKWLGMLVVFLLTQTCDMFFLLSSSAKWFEVEDVIQRKKNKSSQVPPTDLKPHKSVQRAFIPGTTTDDDKWSSFSSPIKYYYRTEEKLQFWTLTMFGHHCCCKVANKMNECFFFFLTSTQLGEGCLGFLPRPVGLVTQTWIRRLADRSLHLFLV